MDHAVQLVGYNADADTPYWIVRNSWGAEWGKPGNTHLSKLVLLRRDKTCSFFYLSLSCLTTTILHMQVSRASST